MSEFFHNPWVVTVGGGVMVSLIGWISLRIYKGTNKPVPKNQKQSVVVNVTNSSNSTRHKIDVGADILTLKAKAKILFIDNETLPHIKSLKKIGWIDYQIKDADNLDIQEIRDADVIFVDHQGVGKLSSDQGLGLVSELKQRYGKEKWIILYSVHAFNLDVFNKGADSFLAKNSTVYEIERKIVEGMTNISV